MFEDEGVIYSGITKTQAKMFEDGGVIYSDDHPQ